MKKKSIIINKGFSLVEILVAVALFSTVMLIGVGALLSLIDANRKAQSLNSVMNNLNFALESMSRNIRVGTDYNCVGGSDNNCPLGGTILSFTSYEGKEIIYQYNSVLKGIERKKEGESSFIPITAPEVIIEKFIFYVDGILDDYQPRVVMVIKGYAGVKEKTRTEFNLQTMVSQRILDL